MECFHDSSCAGFDPRIHPHQKVMDCRVKPGDDDAVDNWVNGRADNGLWADIVAQARRK
jgi:hypothetical protein